MPELQNPVGEWNSWRILATGTTFSLHCNNREAWSCTDHVPRRGSVGFRVFTGPLEIRNVRIREIGFRSLMNIDEWEVYPGYGGNGPLDAHWKRDGLLWALEGPGPSIATRKKDYRNYDLRLEFLFADPNPDSINSGVYLRGCIPGRLISGSTRGALVSGACSTSRRRWPPPLTARPGTTPSLAR